jgi:hypothetical protein
VIYSNFNDIPEAFLYFAKQGNINANKNNIHEIVVSFKEFSHTAESLLPKRFSHKEFESLWEKMAQDHSGLTYNLFSAFLNANKFHKVEKSTK